MGWNAGYTMFEATVIAIYDQGKLDKDLLTSLMEPYRGTDIDSGGSCDLKSKDGKGIEQIVIETWGLQMPQKPICAYEDDPQMWDNYVDEVDRLMRQVREHFGWC